jgi:hypothetical protein
MDGTGTSRISTPAFGAHFTTADIDFAMTTCLSVGWHSQPEKIEKQNP